MEIMKEIDYNNYYEKCYKKLPYIISIAWSSFITLFALIDIFVNTGFFRKTYRGFLVLIVGSESYSSAILAFFLWLILIATGILIFIVSAIVISQKIKVVTELERINKNNLLINLDTSENK